MSERILGDWLDSYLKYVDNTEPPLVFKKWSAISAIAACLQRKCHHVWGHDEIYPNLYVVLVGPSGTRKGTAMGPAVKFLKEMKGVHLAAESTTREALVESLIKSANTFTSSEGEIRMHCSMTIFSKEFTVFLDRTQDKLISNLTDWYDCDSPWEYDCLGRGDRIVYGLWVNLIGATTPHMLSLTLPRESIGGGLMSRIILVYASRKGKIIPCPFLTKEEVKLGEDLMVDLERVSMLRGRFTMTEEYLDAYIPWYEQHHVHPIFTDPKFAPYLERRSTHLRKLSMVLSASRGDDMVLELQDFKRALSILVEAERFMPAVFRGFGRAAYAEVMETVIQYLMRHSPVSLAELTRQFYQDLNPGERDYILITLSKMGTIKMEHDKGGSPEKTMITYTRKEPENESYHSS